MSAHGWNYVDFCSGGHSDTPATQQIMHVQYTAICVSAVVGDRDWFGVTAVSAITREATSIFRCLCALKRNISRFRWDPKLLVKK